MTPLETLIFLQNAVVLIARVRYIGTYIYSALLSIQHQIQEYSIKQIEIKLGYSISSFQKQLWQFMRPELFFTLKVGKELCVLVSLLQSTKYGKILVQYQMCVQHSLEIRGLRSTKCSSETLQNLLYCIRKPMYCSFFRFSFRANKFLPYECPGLCRHRAGHS